MTAIAFGALCFSSLFAVIDPIGTAPVFASLTQHQARAARRRAAMRAVLVALSVLVLFALSGTRILSLFGVSLVAFQIAGGILFVIMAIGMVRGQDDPLSPPGQPVAPNNADPSVVPLGIPLIAGPGAITTVTVLSGRSSDLAHGAAFGAALLAVLALTAAILWIAPVLLARLGQSGVSLITRSMGLVVLAIGVEQILTGLQGTALFH